jgi:hypothetical protein
MAGAVSERPADPYLPPMEVLELDDRVVPRRPTSEPPPSRLKYFSWAPEFVNRGSGQELTAPLGQPPPAERRFATGLPPDQALESADTVEMLQKELFQGEAKESSESTEPHAGAESASEPG